MAVRGQDIVPQAFEDETDVKTDDLDYDLRSLCAFDSHPIDEEAFTADREAYLKESATANAQLLINKLFELPAERSDVGPLARLPLRHATKLPREKPAPERNPQTKWEKFAEEKGIKKKKKSRMVWDDDRQEWAPRHGYKRANSDEKWVVELKEGQEAKDEDFNTEAKANRRKNLENQQKNQDRNDREKKRKLPTGLAPELLENSATAEGALTKKQRGKSNTKEALNLVQHSTASLGKFDEQRRGEPERKTKGIRRQFKSVVGDFQSEKSRSLGMMNRIMGHKPMAQESTDDAEGSSKKKKPFQRGARKGRGNKQATKKGKVRPVK